MPTQRATAEMDAQSTDVTMADRSGLALIGLLLAAATLMVTITAAVAVNDFRADAQDFASVPAAAVSANLTR